LSETSILGVKKLIMFFVKWSENFVNYISKNQLPGKMKNLF